MQRLRLNPGENQSVPIQAPNRKLRVIISDGTRKIRPGELQIWSATVSLALAQAEPRPRSCWIRHHRGQCGSSEAKTYSPEMGFADSRQDGATLSALGAGTNRQLFTKLLQNRHANPGANSRKGKKLVCLLG
jgi:hypothetical protein